MRALKDEVAPVSINIAIEVSEAAAGSQVKATEKLRIDAVGLRGPYFRFMMKLAGAGAGSRAYLKSLEQGLR